MDQLAGPDPRRHAGGSARVLRVAAAALALLAACGGAPDRDVGGADAGPRDLVLVTLDTVRADRLGCYGHAGAETPNLDALAKRGAR